MLGGESHISGFVIMQSPFNPMSVVNTQLVKKWPTPTLAGKAVQTVIGSGALGEGESIGDNGYSKGCLNVGEFSLQEATGSFHAGNQILDRERRPEGGARRKGFTSQKTGMD